MMVDRWREAADAAGLEEKAAELGKTPGELMIIASLIEAEGRGDDMPKISRVIYNRLDGPGDKGGTNGTLGIDASIAYGLGLAPGSTELTPDQLAEDTPYNTRINAGLPPTPIEAPGDDAIAAAANPRRRRLVLLRHGRPLDGRDQVRRGLRRVPRATATSTRPTARPPTRAEPTRAR